ncbi:MAG: metal ABC transporter permease [Bacteroidetes bacterium]|nr:metal ABC transporter permease [Bacteroidota bacterium]
MELLLEFLSFSDPNIRFVVLGSVLLTASSAIVGCFTFLKKKALVGDAVAHSILPGVCLGFLLAGSKNPLYLIVGAFITGWLSLVIIDAIVAKSKIKEDTAIGLILSVFFGMGILLLTMIQHSGNAAQSGLDQFLFGKAAALVGQDLIVFSIVAVTLIFFVVLFFKEFTLISFDKDLAIALGFPVRRIELVLTTLTVLAVVIGIQAVGVVLMAAILITPAAAARFWTDRVKIMVILAALFGAFSGFAGAFISYAAPAMPTGPWIVVVISIIAFTSFFFAPKKGILYRTWNQRKIKRQMVEENILKTIYSLGAISKNYFQPKTEQEILEARNFETSQLHLGLNRLKSQGYLKRSGDQWVLSPEGRDKGQHVVKLHRLWEVYLTKYLRIAPDHVHEDAETIEHVITPELEVKLEKLLKYPKLDPHESEIPYS